MFETVEIGRKTGKAEFERTAAYLRPELLRLQGEIAATHTAVVIIIGGVEGAGKGETVNLLLEWMDARGIRTHAFGEPGDEERARPRFWRYWMALPPRGKIGILFGSWYTTPIIDLVFRNIKDGEFDQELDRIVDFERMLAAEGVLILKFWMHISKKDQKKRLEALSKNPATKWRVTALDWRFFKLYDRFRSVSEHALRRTSTGDAPWHVVEGTDARYRSLAVTRIIRDALDERVRAASAQSAADADVARADAAVARAASAAPPAPRKAEELPTPQPLNIINRLDFSLHLSQKKYDGALLAQQGRLNRLVRQLPDAERSLILVFEGSDAAGKGGAIRRVTAALDARQYSAMSVASPTEEERAQPYLWRFWRNLPRQGRVSIYDRSWYGRVLVERLEGFCAPADWQRAYGEINAFEEQLVEAGSIIVKYWMAIGSHEQLRRFKEREKTPYKQYKITAEDWRNREKWPAYEAAACDMIERTSTEIAPWTLVEADDKRWARIKVLKTACDRLEAALDGDH